MLTEVVKQILSKPVSWMGWNNGGKDEVKWVNAKIQSTNQTHKVNVFSLQTLATRSAAGVGAVGRNGRNKSGETIIA